MEPPVEVYHRLKLYDESGVNNAKKPVSRAVHICSTMGQQ
jgi:hypothetical protein